MTSIENVIEALAHCSANEFHRLSVFLYERIQASNPGNIQEALEALTQEDPNEI